MSRLAEALLKDAQQDDWCIAPETNAPRFVTPPQLTGERRTRPPSTRLSPSQRSIGPERADWRQAWATIAKYWRLSAFFASIVMVVVVGVTIFTKPVYEAAARVEIDPPGAELFSLEGRNGSDDGTDYLETQSRNLKSDQLLITVLRQMHLEQVPEFTERSAFSRTISGVLSAIESLPSRIWRRKQSASTAVTFSDPEALTPQEVSVLHAMQSQLTVKRDTASRLVNVSFATHDPALSAAVTNTLVRCFIDRTYQTRHTAIMESTEWLSKQLDDIRTKMEQSNHELAEFQRVSGIADVDQNRSTFTEAMAALSREKSQAQAERIQIESYLRKVHNGELENLPQVQSNQVIQILTQKLGETRAELSQSLAVYGKNHPNVRKLQNQVEELESQIRLQRNAIVGQMETSYAAALSREQMIDGTMRGTARELGQMAQYTALKKEAQVSADLYNGLYARVKEAGIAAASKSVNIRIVDQARVPDSPTRPRPLLNLGVGLFVALCGGLLLGFVLQALDTKVHTLEDVRQSLGVATVSMIPIANGHRSAFNALTTALGGSMKGSLDGPTNFLLDQPGSEQSEALRGIHTSVMLSQPGHPPQAVLVVSSVPGEGKTTVAINLAVALAHQGKTCLLDADLRRPSVAKAFHLADSDGLSNYLIDSAPLESLFVAVPKVPGLAILPAGKAISDPGKFINSGNMRLLILNLRKRFDFLVVDSPPILPYADGRALAPSVDGIVFVGRAGAVTREAMARSMELLQQVHSAPILEVVLNGATTAAQSYGYGYGYSYAKS